MKWLHSLLGIRGAVEFYPIDRKLITGIQAQHEKLLKENQLIRDSFLELCKGYAQLVGTSGAHNAALKNLQLQIDILRKAIEPTEDDIIDACLTAKKQDDIN